MTKRIVELGAGRFPAIKNPGTEIVGGDVSYAAVDAEGVVPPFIFHKSILGSTYENLPLESYVAPVSALPLPDASCDAIITRSMFGQYTLSRMNTSELEETLQGIAESYRVLKPGGELVIAEEDTPLPREKLLGAIGEASFTNVVCYDARYKSNQSWRAERVRYWGLEDVEVDAAGNEFWNYAPGFCMSDETGRDAYLLKAVKPIV